MTRLDPSLPLSRIGAKADDPRPTPERLDAVARAICRESCAFRGEPPCWSIGDGLSPHCDEPGCASLAAAALGAIGP